MYGMLSRCLCSYPEFENPAVWSVYKGNCVVMLFDLKEMKNRIGYESFCLKNAELG
ncbi:MAG: hypothetical protein WCS73_06595 [Lentisphaeria bacterium]